MLLCMRLQTGMHHHIGCEIQVVTQVGLQETAWSNAQTQSWPEFIPVFCQELWKVQGMSFTLCRAPQCGCEFYGK